MTIVTYYAVLATLVLIAHSNVCVNAEEELVDLDITVNQCPMSRTKTKPSPEAKLRYCTEYTSSSCCTPQEDVEVEKEINFSARSLYSHCPGCLANAKRFKCAYTCSPDQFDFINLVKPAGSTKKSGQIKMCTTFCQSWFKSCVNTTIAERYSSNANSFCVNMINSGTENSIVLSKYGCYNDADAANTCSGDTIPPLPKNRI